MIDVKNATSKAIEYLKSFYPDIENILLEEIELTDNKKFWFITLSFDMRASASGGILMLGNIRKYKIFKIDAETGEVLSMKIRDIK